ncbi:cyclase [Actinophytocola sediminis]
MKSALSRAAIGVFATAAAVLALAQPASAAAFDIVYDCQADTPLGAENLTLNQAVDATAPATVAAGQPLDVVVDPGPNQVPSEAAGYEIKEVHSFTLKVPVPSNATLDSVELTGGAGLGPNPPTWSEDAGVVTVAFAGPIAGGASFELPTVTAHLTAGASGTIDSSLYGTSYDDAGLNFTAVVSTFIGDISAPTSCFPNPNPTLTSTAIA